MAGSKKTFGGWLLAVGALLFVGGATAQSNNTVADAQIESNVLRALASAPDLSTQNIQTATVYGVVTLSGNVHSESMRSEAENLVARAQGVKKVVDQLTLGDTPPPAQAASEPQAEPAQANGEAQSGQVLMSDGTYAPANGAPGQQQGPPPPDQVANQSQEGNGYPPSPSNQPGNPGGGYQPGYGQPGPPLPPQERQPMYANGPYNYVPPAGVAQGQRAGLDVTVPAGAVLKIRINRGLDSNHLQPGTPFDGTILNDIVANGAVAIPRGATVQGTVVDARKAGVFKGHGEIGLEVNSITLGGNVYPITTQVWQREGRDKTAGTVNQTAGTSAIGALFGALAGGGEGAAIGAGVGAGLGLAGSAASPRGTVIIPPESVLTFTTAQPVAVKTVSQAEMARLSYAAGPGQPPPPPGRPMRRYYSPYYGYYWGPAY